MEIIKSYINAHFKTLFIVSSLIVLSIFLLMFRLKITHSFFYLFLVWNLFLAILPFSITSYLKEQHQLSKVAFCVWLIIWFLFIPNAPYIVTDIIHLRLSPPKIIFYDALTIISFAISGLLLFLFSLRDMTHLFESHFKTYIPKYIKTSFFFTVSFGVYLGRFLRYNSWEILSNPKHLFLDIFYIISDPMEHKVAWAFTIFFGLTLKLTASCFNLLAKIEH